METERRCHERVFTRATAHVEHSAVKLPRVGELLKRRLGSADVPGRNAHIRGVEVVRTVLARIHAFDHQWTERAFRPNASSPSMPMLMIRFGLMRNMGGSKPRPTVSPPVGKTSASPRTSIIRGRHGSTDARSSMTMATRGLRCTSRYFFRCAKP